ncbi:MAG TPA: DUF2851 family protein [Flavitalea sp.]|nr:DUF2851 family protein [Flavitalea sp.]
MNERLLQFIWQHQYYNHTSLEFTNGCPFQIIHQGIFNSHQGPDFTEARIAFDNQLWIGNIELHVRSSDWKKHDHQHDANYNNVICHVVWIDDETNPANSVPVFLLGERIPKLLLSQYETWMHGDHAFVPCINRITEVDVTVHSEWQLQLIEQRLNEKTEAIKKELMHWKFHWEQTCWILMAKNFGIRVNTELFEAVARSLPLNLIGRHKQQIHSLEALLLGQAGLLESEFEEQYPRLLQKEYRFLRKKYNLRQVFIPVHFLRMRPLNFPTVRLAQLAMFLHTSAGFFSIIRDGDQLSIVRKKLAVTANDYWHYHYRPDQLSSFLPKQVGADMIDNLVINTISPLLYAFGKIQNQACYIEKAFRWLTLTGAEKNSHTKGFYRAGLKAANALESQALLELKTNFCDERKCLECGIGKTLLAKT